MRGLNSVDVHIFASWSDLYNRAVRDGACGAGRRFLERYRYMPDGLQQAIRRISSSNRRWCQNNGYIQFFPRNIRRMSDSRQAGLLIQAPWAVKEGVLDPCCFRTAAWNYALPAMPWLFSYCPCKASLADRVLATVAEEVPEFSKAVSVIQAQR